MPFSIAAASTKVLKVEPACRVDCATRLNWLPFVLTTAVIARIAPVPGSTETIAAAGSVLYGRTSLIAFLARYCSRGSMVV